MIDIEEAKRRALAYLETLGLEEGPALLESDALDFGCGWLFYYTSNRYLRTNNMDDAPCGNNPVIVDRQEGGVYSTGFYQTDRYIQQFKEDKHNLIRVDVMDDRRLC